MIVLVAVIVIIAVAVWLNRGSQHTSLQINNKTYRLLVADTQAERQKGLSGRAALPDDEAMLFVFAGESTRCMWMKDMRFAIDIVWLDRDKQIVQVKEHVSPDTYPRSFCAHAQYVLELHAGQIREANIHPGQTLHF